MYPSENIPLIPLADGHVRIFHATNKASDAANVFATGLDFSRYPALSFKAFGPYDSATAARQGHASLRNQEGAWQNAWVIYFDIPENLAESFLEDDIDRGGPPIDKNVYHEYCSVIFSGKNNAGEMDHIIGGYTKYPAAYKGSFANMVAEAKECKKAKPGKPSITTPPQ